MRYFRPWYLALWVAAVAAAAHDARAGQENLLANPGFESLTADQPDRWDYFVEPKPGAVARLDDTAHDGDYAVWLHTPSPYEKEPVNNWSQNIIAEFGGETLRVRGFIRVAEAREAALWLQCWRKRPWGVLAAASTSIDSPVYGTADWQEVSMDVDVPAGTDFVTVRCVLLGAGSAWFDDLSLTRVSPESKSGTKAETVSVPAGTAEGEAAAPEKASTAPGAAEGEAAAPEKTSATVGEAPKVPGAPSAVSPEEARRQEAAVMPLVTQLENEVKRLREANLLLTDTLQQIQEVNQGLVNEMMAVQAELRTLKEKGEGNAAAPPLDAVENRVPPLIPLSEAAEYEAP